MQFIEKKHQIGSCDDRFCAFVGFLCCELSAKKLGNGASANLENPEIEEVREVWEFCWWSGKTSMYYQTCAIVAVILFQTRSVTSYFGLFGSDFYSLFCYF